MNIASDSQNSLSRVGERLLLIAFFLTPLATPFQLFLYPAIILLLIGLLKTSGKIPFQLKRSDLFLAAFLLTAVIGAIFARNITEAFAGCSVFLAYVLVYLFFRTNKFSPDFYPKFIKSVSFSIVFFCGFALIHYYIIRQELYLGLFGIEIFHFYPTIQDFQGSPLVSIFQWSSRGGNLLATLLVFLLSYITVNFKKINNWERFWVLLAILTGFFTMLLTQTRGALIYIMVSLVIMIVLSRHFKLLLILAVMVAALFLFQSGKVQSTLADPFNAPNLPGRILQYDSSLEIFRNNNPVTGIGILNFKSEYQKGYSDKPGFEKVPYIHNVYLSLLVESGLAGSLSFFGFIISIFITLMLYHFRNWGSAYYNTAVLNAIALISGFFTNALVDNLLYVVPIGIFLWIALGLAYNPSINQGLTEK